MPVKPGYQTSQFWLHVVLGMVITGVTAVIATKDLGLPPIAQAGLDFVGPLLLTWLTRQYTADRTALYAASADAGKAAVAAAPAAPALADQVNAK